MARAHKLRSIGLPDAYWEIIVGEAAREDRNVSNMVQRLMKEALEGRGFDMRERPPESPPGA